MASTTLKRSARTAIVAGMLSATAVVPAMQAAADTITVPGIGAIEVPATAGPAIDIAAPAGNITDIAAPAVSQGQAVADAALTKVGSPYVYGASGPNAFDCSGLVQWAHGQVGKQVPRTSQSQAAGGAPVSINNLQAGDVVLMYGGASHAGIYIGNGQVVHALNSSSPVKVDNLADFPFHSARRY
ncbi:C40 family peptidase [Hoyosella sp. G463]|uniref:C40 family peptidase n=1 Tax=Lolliginicoccus lacisalsi TaxID=2742202 RepID=A0A927J9G0_9ACTN|nr:C40 family peptidase [Lolliginicoccus lacisalsi]MBD8505136.1 C40 family peptidase [Lolliginicoccus lacisalsi]